MPQWIKFFFGRRLFFYEEKHDAKQDLQAVQRIRPGKSDQEKEISKVKESIMKGKEEGHGSPGSGRWLDGSVVHPHTVGAEVLEIIHLDEVEKTDGNALPPIDPHQDTDFPILNQGENHDDEVREEQGIKRTVETDLLPGLIPGKTDLHFSFPFWPD